VTTTLLRGRITARDGVVRRPDRLGLGRVEDRKVSE
jgi:dihydroorotase